MTSGPPTPAPDADRGLPRERRLRRRAEFDRVMRQGRKVVHPAVVAWVLPSPAEVERPRLGLAVGRKVGHSPARNRVKRVLRAAFALLTEADTVAVDVVVVVRPGGAPRDLAAAREALDDVLTRARRPGRRT